MTFSSTASHPLTNFINIKIKLAYFFKNTHKNRICKHIFIGVNVYTCINNYACSIKKKKVLI
jgi:hypothetical protein